MIESHKHFRAMVIFPLLFMEAEVTFLRLEPPAAGIYPKQSLSYPHFEVL